MHLESMRAEGKESVHMLTLYTLATDIWKSAKWVWSAVVITILVGVVTSLFAGKQADVVNTTVATVIKWFQEFHFYQDLILSFIGLFIVITLASGIIKFVLGKDYERASAIPHEVQVILDYIKKDMEATKQREEVQQVRDKEAFTQYLRSIEETCENIRPRGFAQLSRAMVFADVPLNETFVHLQVVSDEPVYDAPGEQQRQLEAMRRRTDLSIEEREAYLQRLYIIWQSQLRRDVDEEEARQPLFLEEILPRLTPTNPVAILLGTAGSGKTTFVRWLALHMARASLKEGKYSLPNGLGREQVPILVQTREYAERLDKEEYLSLKQFLISQWSRMHPNLALKLLDELAQGRCLVLFDGLDQGASVNVRRRVIEGIDEFIGDYSSEESDNYNRFIITSRIADSEPGAFSKYAHYTLIDLDRQRIEQFLANWCLAIARYRAMSVKGMHPLTDTQEAEARIAGAKQQEQVARMLTGNPSLMRLAINPMTLTIMVLLQTSGRNLLVHPIELYQMVTRTLLDTWNSESGRKMFLREEIPLAEQLLSNLAFRLQESGTMLTAYDVAMTTHQTLAAFHERQPGEIRESEIAQFIETLRRSSGLFVEGGEGLFYFANRTIQDYYVVLYLLHMPQEELKQFAFQQYHAATWGEPLLLALTYKGRQSPLIAPTRQLDKPVPEERTPTQPLAPSNPEERARNLQALQRVQQLTGQRVEVLLAACTDRRPLSSAARQELGVGTVQEMAWKVLRQPFVLDQEALNTVLKGLDSSMPSVCEGAAMLLQQSKSLPQDIQQRAAQKIWQILLDSNVQQRFSPLSYFELLRFYDTLFETLKVITDHA